MKHALHESNSRISRWGSEPDNAYKGTNNGAETDIDDDLLSAGPRQRSSSDVYSPSNRFNVEGWSDVTNARNKVTQRLSCHNDCKKNCQGTPWHEKEKILSYERSRLKNLRLSHLPEHKGTRAAYYRDDRYGDTSVKSAFPGTLETPAIKLSVYASSEFKKVMFDLQHIKLS